jgi:hypothetical protein
MRRLVETTAPGVFLPDPPHDFVGRAEDLEALYAALVEKQDKALLLEGLREWVRIAVARRRFREIVRGDPELDRRNGPPPLRKLLRNK